MSLLIAWGVVSWLRLAHSPEHLLAEAYSQRRIFELRMPGARFAEVAPVHLVRGDANHAELRDLADARRQIEHQLRAVPDDPRWLQLKAQADILEQRYDPAIEALERLIAKGPVTAGLLMDDGAAHFERGEATDSTTDRAAALDCMRRADELAPGDPVVLFNEAVVMEEQGQLMNAIETWNRYLRFEQDPLWQQEGRRRVQALEQKLNQLNPHRAERADH